MSFFSEPKQEPNTGHIVNDERSRVWLEVPDQTADNYASRLSGGVTWVCFSALAFKLVRLLTTSLPIAPIVLSIGLLLLPVAFVIYKRCKDDDGRFSTLVYITLVVLGLVIGGF